MQASPPGVGDGGGGGFVGSLSLQLLCVELRAPDVGQLDDKALRAALLAAGEGKKEAKQAAED